MIMLPTLMTSAGVFPHILNPIIVIIWLNYFLTFYWNKFLVSELKPKSGGQFLWT